MKHDFNKKARFPNSLKTMLIYIIITKMILFCKISNEYYPNNMTPYYWVSVSSITLSLNNKIRIDYTICSNYLFIFFFFCHHCCVCVFGYLFGFSSQSQTKSFIHFGLPDLKYAVVLKNSFWF